MRVLVNYDDGQVKTKMDITYPHLIREMKPVKQMIDLYPALSVTNLVSLRKCIILT